MMSAFQINDKSCLVCVSLCSYPHLWSLAQGSGWKNEMSSVKVHGVIVLESRLESSTSEEVS